MRIVKTPLQGLLLSFVCYGFFSTPSFASADFRSEKIHTADIKKTKAYVRDGLIIGGDRAINDVIIKGIRKGTNGESSETFERVVVDLTGTTNGEITDIQRPPYYQLSVSPEERRLIVSIWGRPKLNFNAQKVTSAFKRSSVIQNVVLLPRLEEDSWTFVLELKAESPVEVFELSNPVRLVMDIQRKKN